MQKFTVDSKQLGHLTLPKFGVRGANQQGEVLLVTKWIQERKQRKENEIL
jgi:hypothetical protein